MNSDELQAPHRCALEALRRPCDVLVVAAHPDDETVGMAATLGLLADAGSRVRVLHVTDGAPRDPALRAALRDRTPSEAAAIRRAEAQAALGGQSIELLPSLGVADQEAATELAAIARAIAPYVAGADVVVTHPYEGGHPDHDATAFAVHAAARLAPGALGSSPAKTPGPLVAEMTSYHASLDGRMATAAFLGEPPCSAAWPGELDATSRARRRRMLDAYASQSQVLASFGVDREPLRCAPLYDFTAKPHPGALWYEGQGYGWTWARFRELLARATLLLRSVDGAFAEWPFAPRRGGSAS